ncbi:hypothetical protein [Mycolicibacillus koreensis]|nr:hypothetical protein [Mycolicibacillus koreensis]BBY54013.1 hypothetical protein MKOR_12640 [Mycolicibacillus koreensis]
MDIDSTWPIPDDLSPQGRKAAEIIRGFLADSGMADHGGGGRFYSPQQWRDRGESYGTGSELIITHDGGDHAGAFNMDYGHETVERLGDLLAADGLYVEGCTNWYSAVYPI